MVVSPNVMVPPVDDEKRTVPLPLSHDAEVELLVQVPLNSQPVVAPKEKYPPELMVVFELTVLLPEAPALMPPATAASVVMITTNVDKANRAPELTVRVPATVTSLAMVTVPAAEMVRLLNVLSPERMVMVLLAPDIVTVLVPSVNVELAPLVSQLPEAVQEPLVNVIVPLVPPVIVTSETLTVAALDVRMPELPTVSAPPVRPSVLVPLSSSVVDDVSETVRVPPQSSARVTILNV